MLPFCNFLCDRNQKAWSTEGLYLAEVKMFRLLSVEWPRSPLTVRCIVPRGILNVPPRFDWLPEVSRLPAVDETSQSSSRATFQTLNGKKIKIKMRKMTSRGRTNILIWMHLFSCRANRSNSLLLLTRGIEIIWKVSVM